MQTVPPITATAPAPATADAVPSAADACRATAQPVIRVKDLSFRYPCTDRDTLRNVDLPVERDDLVAVVGGKLGAVSMASMAAFVSLDPVKLSDALLWLRAPEPLAFGVSYGYRMLPILVDEYVTVFGGQRLRHAPVDRPGLPGWRVAGQWCVLAVTAFSPIMLNTAKNVRTTVEALETRGFTYGASNRAGLTLRLAYLRVSVLDLAELAASAVLVAAAFPLGARIPGLG